MASRGLDIRILATLGLLLAVGCNRDHPEVPPPADSVAAADTAVTAIGVEAEGLRLFVITTGAARPLPFGSDSAVVHETIARAARAAAIDSGTGGDCPGSFARWSNGLSLRFVSGRFVGWSLAGGDGAVSTATGIGIGSTRGQVEDAHATQVATTSLGTEFNAGGLAGLYDGPGAEAKVTNLWAGEVCIAR